MERPPDEGFEDALGNFLDEEISHASPLALTLAIHQSGLNLLNEQGAGRYYHEQVEAEVLPYEVTPLQHVASSCSHGA